ncbi:MAG: potassium channel protein [Sneathiella sp.]|nr:potassium channel protein [Sneathiella sp.]
MREVLTTLFYLTLIIVLHTAAMMAFEALSFRDSLWLTLVSITTVGYGDFSAQSDLGRWATTLLIFLGGIFVLGKIAGDFLDFRSNQREAKKAGHWSYNRMKNHIVIIGSKNDSETHLLRLITEFQRNPETSDQEIILITSSFGTDFPFSFQQHGVKFVNGRGSDPTFLKQAGVSNAEIVILLAWDENDSSSDGHAYDIVSRIREMGSTASLVVECVDNNNRSRLESSGASLVLRPIRAYPEMIIGGLLNPGTIPILENLFTATGESIVVEEGATKGTWMEIVTATVSEDKGVPIAYRSRETGATITSPAGSSAVDADALFILRG